MSFSVGFCLLCLSFFLEQQTDKDPKQKNLRKKTEKGWNLYGWLLSRFGEVSFLCKPNAFIGFILVLVTSEISVNIYVN